MIRTSRILRVSLSTCLVSMLCTGCVTTRSPRSQGEVAIENEADHTPSSPSRVVTASSKVDPAEASGRGEFVRPSSSARMAGRVPVRAARGGAGGVAGIGIAGDFCLDAIALEVPSDMALATSLATLDTAQACGSALIPTAPGVWFKVQGTGNRITVSTCNEFGVFDTQISVFCDGCEQLSCVDGNDDDLSCPSMGLLSTVSWCSERGTEYFILVHGFGQEVGGCILQVWDDGLLCSDPPSCVSGPSNDQCSDCLHLQTDGQDFGSTVGATGSDITTCAQADTADVWHCWRADCTGTATFSLCGSSFDTTLAVFNDCGGQELACDDDGCGGTFESELSMAVVAGDTYFVRVAGFGGATGDYSLLVSCDAPSGACCDDSTGVCNDVIDPLNCPPPNRFAADTLCSDLVPACGGPVLEACCMPDGLCRDYAREECLELGGTPQGAGTNCNTTTCPQPCELTCPAGSTLENESDCGLPNDTVNGGCNSSPPTFSRIRCGETICGTAAVDDQLGMRDTDWYEISVTQPTSFTWTVRAEFATLSGVVDTDPYGAGNCDASLVGLAPFEYGNVCGESSVTACVGPGTYWFFVGPDASEEFLCGERRKYIAELTCATCSTGACCRSSGGCDMVGGTTCGDLGGVYAGDGTECDPNCCQQSPQGADVCFDAIPYAVPVNGTPIAVSGNNANATAGGACDSELGSTLVWWEAFRIDACADVVIEYCCTDPSANPVYAVLNDACPDCDLISAAAWGAGGGMPGCADGNIQVLWEGLPAGDYTYPIFSGPDGPVHGPYQLHITAYPCTSGACCLDGTCIGTMSRLQCAERGGTWFDGEDCASGYVCPGATGACCDVPTGTCRDDVLFEDCVGAQQVWHEGLLCTDAAVACNPPTEACCFSGGDCTDREPGLCDDEGGIPQGSNTNCNTTRCEPLGACCMTDLTCEGLLAQYCSGRCLCSPDMNCDGALDANDLSAFALALSDPVGYANTYPNCDIWWADLDCDQDLDELDRTLFDCLVRQSGPADCIDIDPASCSAVGGSSLGIGTGCADIECRPLGACCAVGTCAGVMIEEACRETAGTWFEGDDCTTANCPPPSCAQSLYPACLGECSEGSTCEPSLLAAVCACGSIECAPTADGTACEDAPCSDPNQSCVAKCMHYDPLTGETTITDCDCRESDSCYFQATMPGSVGNPCVVADDGSGTVTLPPAGCQYVSPDEVHEIIDGLPPGTTIELDAIHKDFICRQEFGNCSALMPPGTCEAAGGSLGGNVDCFESTLELSISGTGALAGFNRTLSVPISCEVHTGPRNPGDPVQTFPTDMFRLQGQLFGDPDFCTFSVTGGTDNGLPSPGHTILTQVPGAGFIVDSFFDITYQIEFAGCPGSRLEGLTGTTTATLRMQAGSGTAQPTCAGTCPAGTVCNETNVVNPDGTIDICCDCVGPPAEACCLRDGTCRQMSPLECRTSDGVPGGGGSSCGGDSNGDGRDDLCEPDEPCQHCGNTAHWVDSCPGGLDTMPTEALVGIAFNDDCESIQNLRLPGLVTIRRGAGDPSTHMISTEIVSMVLSGGGVTMRAGAGGGVGGVLRPSVGLIREQASDPSMADSFFDVFVEVSGDGLDRPIYNQQPITVQSKISCVPPQTRYIHINSCIPMYDSPLAGQGIIVAWLVAPDHTTYPTQACCTQGQGCAEMRPEDCRRINGVPKGSGSTCVGDNNGNGTDDLCEPDEPCDHCGGSDHWVDQCPGGQDTMPSEALVGIAFNDDCVPDLNLRLPGPVTIQRDPGDPTTHSISTEIVSMNLSGGGITMRAGAGGGEGGVLRPSHGLIQEQAGDASMAESSFAVFVEVSGAGLAGPVYNHQPINVQSKIPCVPPDTRYIHIDSCIPLYDSPVAGQGNIAAWLVAPNHTTYPTQACCLEDGECAQIRPEQCRLRDGAPKGTGSTCTPDLCLSDEPCQHCGNTAHWVDSCPGGLDTMPTEALVGIAFNDDCVPALNLRLPGLATIRRGAGDPSTHMISTEIVSMSLSAGGVTMRAGAGGGVGGVLRPSVGLIREQGNDPTMADSFFDVFVEVSGDGLDRPIYNQQPITVQSKISCVPPQTRYIHINSCIPMYDAPVGGTIVAYLVDPDHTTYPTEACCFEDGGCEQMRPELCRQHGGRPQGSGSTCTPDLCPVPRFTEIDEFYFSVGVIDILLPDGTTESVDMTGDATAEVYFESIVEGSAVDDDGNGREEVATRMTDLNMSGISPLLGPIHVTLNPNIPSVGQIEETIDITQNLLDVPPFGPPGSTADSYFDLYFQVSVPDLGLTLHTVQPKRMSGRISHKPPGPLDWYEGLTDIQLYDANGNPTNYYLGATRHRPRPPIACCFSDGACGDIPGDECQDLGGVPQGVGTQCEGAVCDRECPQATIGSSYPFDKTVDARQPSPVNAPLPRQGIGSPGNPADPRDMREPIMIRLDPPQQGAEQCFDLCETAVDQYTGPNAIQSVTYLGDGAYEIILRRAITAGAVTTIQYMGDGSFVEYYSHPANADGDSASAPPDILKIIDYLNGVATSPWGIYSEDIDRSNQLEPPDILRVIDLLNGAGSYDSWLNVNKPVNRSCPARP